MSAEEDQLAHELQQSLIEASRRNPDAARKVVDLSDRYSLPMDTVDRNLKQVEDRDKLANLPSADEIIRGHPATAEFLRDRRNAAIAVDDVETLTRLEDELKGDEHSHWSNVARRLVSRTNELIGNTIQFGGTLADDYRSLDLPDPGIKIGEDGISWHWNLPEDATSALTVMGRYVSEGEAHRVGYVPRYTWEKLKADPTLTNFGGLLAEQGLGSLPDMAAAKYTLSAYMTSLTQEIAENRAANNMRTDVDTGDLLVSAPTAAFIAVMELVGAKAVLDITDIVSPTQLGQAVGRAFVRESGTEFVQEGAQYYGETVGTARPVSHLEALDRSFAGAVVGGPFGGGVRAATGTVQLLANRVVKRSRDVGRSMQEQENLDRIISLAQSSRTNERAQDKFREFLRGAGKNRGVYVPLTVVESLAAEGYELPAYLTDQAGRHLAAISPDGDVFIPMDRFGTEIVTDPELLTAMRPHARLSAQGLSSTDLADDTNADIERMVAAAQAHQELKTQADAIFEQVRDELVATGRQSAETARWSAALYPAMATTLASDGDISIEDAFRMMNFSVVGPGAASTPGAPALNQELINGVKFWSALERGVENAEMQEWKKPDDVAKGSAIWAMVQPGKAAGVKGAELRFTGLEEFLHPYASYDINPSTYEPVEGLEGAWGVGEIARPLLSDEPERYEVDTEDNGKFTVRILRRDGAVAIFDESGESPPIEYNAAFSNGKTLHELLMYTYEPAGVTGVSRVGEDRPVADSQLDVEFETEAEARKFIKDKGEVKFTRQQVLQYVRDYRLQLEEQVAGPTPRRGDDMDSDEDSQFNWPDQSDGEILDDPSYWEGDTENDSYDYSRIQDPDYNPVNVEEHIVEWLKNWYNDESNDKDWLEKWTHEGVTDDRRITEIDINVSEPAEDGTVTISVVDAAEPSFEVVSRSGVPPIRVDEAIAGVRQRFQEALDSERGAYIVTGEDPDRARLVEANNFNALWEDASFRAALANAADSDFYTYAYDQARDTYMSGDDQVRRWNVDAGNSEVVIEGSDDYGYSVMVDGREVGDGNIHSYDEATVQAAAHANIRGGGDGLRGEWGRYIAEGESSQYREQKIALVNHQGDDYKHMHFPEQNLIVFNRLTNRPGNELRLEESQSDWASNARKAGGFKEDIPPVDQDEMNALSDLVEDQLGQAAESMGIEPFRMTAAGNRVPTDEFSDFRASAYWWLRGAEGTNVGAVETYYNRVNEALQPFLNQGLQELYNDMVEMQELSSTAATAPSWMPYGGNTWTPLALKYALVEAISGDYKTLAWNDNRTLQTIWSPANDYHAQYNQRMVSMMKKLTGQQARHVTLDGEPYPEPDLSGWRVERGEGGVIRVYDEQGIGTLRNVRGFPDGITDEQIIHREASRDLPQGKWVIDVTPDLKRRLLADGFSLMQKQLGMYSAVERATEKLKLPGWKQEGGTEQGSVIWAKLQPGKAPNVTGEEIKWLGLEEFLNPYAGADISRDSHEVVPASGDMFRVVERDGDQNLGPTFTNAKQASKFIKSGGQVRFTRGEVLNFINNHGMTIEETVAEESDESTDQALDWKEEVWKDEEAWKHNVDDMLYDYNQGGVPTDGRGKPIFDSMNWLYDNFDEFVNDHSDRNDDHKQMIVEQDVGALQDYFVSQNMDFDEALRQAAREDAEEAFKKEAKKNYLNNPMFIQKSEAVPGLIIFGNDDLGWDVRTSMEWDSRVRPLGTEIIYSAEEAQIQAREYAVENGMIEGLDNENVAKFGPQGEGYIDMDSPAEVEKYWEYKLKLPGIDADFREEAHFDEPNIIAFLRVSERSLPREPTDEEYEQFRAQQEADQRATEGQGPSEEELQAAFDASKQAVIDFVARRIDDPRALDPVSDGAYLEDRITNPSTWFEIAQKFGGVTVEEYDAIRAYSEMKEVQLQNEYTFKEARDRTLRLTARTFFIDEAQSDWASEARKIGMQTGADQMQLRRARDELRDELDQMVDSLYRSLKDPQDSLLRVPGTSGFDSVTFREYATLTDDTFRDYRHDKSGYDGVQAILPDDIKARKAEWVAAEQALNVEVHGAPAAPFMGESWLRMSMKRGLLLAAQQGFDRFAWIDAAAKSEQWGGVDFTTQYDQRMVSIIKKLLGVEPQHFNNDGDPLDRIDRDREQLRSSYEIHWDDDLEAHVIIDSNGEHVRGHAGGIRTFLFEANATAAIDNMVTEQFPHQPGYWSIELTPELREQILTEAFPIYQQGDDKPRAQFFPDSRQIRLTADSDLSSFLHETAHMFLDVEKQFAQSHGPRPHHAALLKYLDADDWSDIDPYTAAGAERHEKLARSFESYLREGKAPSLALRDAFAAFRRWLVQVYESIVMLDVEINDDIRGVFDRMLATDVEIAEAAANPAYDQYFESAEQAGMTATEWESYQNQRKRRTEAATIDVTSKAIQQYMNRRTAEWNEERAPLIDEERERLAAMPVYLVMAELAEYPMNRDQLVEAMGGQLSKRLNGKLIGRATRGENTIDPQVYAEKHGFETVSEMAAQIEAAPGLTAAATDAAQARMVEKYGDILNDGTLEAEAREALHNEEQAKLLLMELAALRPRGTPEINRDYLKAEARRVIGTMRYSEINPSRYDRAEIRAAQRAERTRGTDEAYDAKVQQITNHYLYREAMDVRRSMERQRRYVRQVQTRTYNPKQVHPDYIRLLQTTANLYFLKNREQQQADVDQILNWYVAQMSVEADVRLMDENLVLAIEAKNRDEFSSFRLPEFDDLTADQLRGVYEMLRHLRFLGGKLSDAQSVEIAAERRSMVESINDNGGRNVRDPERPGRGSGALDLPKYLLNTLPSLRNMIRTLDNTFEEPEREGVAERLIWRQVEQGFNNRLEVGEKLYELFNDALTVTSRISLSRKDLPAIVTEKGHKLYFTEEGAFMMALYWGTETSREAVREGYGMNDAEVMTVLGNLSPDHLTAINSIWSIHDNEVWPMLSSAHFKRYGVVPTKLDATPFEVNGVQMTGGHMRLFYDSVELKMRAGDEAAGQSNSVVPDKAGSMHERVGSGGRKVLLDKNNILRSIEENAHFIAFAEPAAHVSRLVDARDVAHAIQTKHGEPFYEAFHELLAAQMRGKPAAQARIMAQVGKIARYFRKVAIAKFLMLSIRNTVQQLSVIPMMVQEIGNDPVRLANTIAHMALHRSDAIEAIQRRSPFMRNRTRLVNREVSETIKQLSISSGVERAYEVMGKIGFAPQSYVDALFAYPLWMIKYEQEMDLHGDETRAISNADTSVAETVGSGSDLHLSLAFNSNNPELVKALTVFGSYFNSYYQRMYNHTNGFTSARPAGIATMTVIPWLAGILTAVLIVDMPGDDSEEEWWKWHVRNYGSFLGSTALLIRDTVQVFFSGFGADTPIASALKTAPRLPAEIEAFFEGEQSGLKTTSDVIKVGSTFFPAPGSGQITRMMDYVDSHQQDNEGDFNAYQMMTEGPDKN